MPRYAALQRAHRAALVLLVVAPAVLCAQTRRSGFATDRLARIDRVMQHYVDSGQIGGAVGLVLEDGRVVYRHAVGWLDKEAGRRMTRDALFRIASQTKAITTEAILSLVEEGKIALGDPVSRFIPAFAHTTVATKSDTGLVVKPATRSITIKDLLTHTAGISYGTDGLIAPLYAAKGLGPAAGWGWYTADKDEPICSTMERLATLPFTAQPGEKWVYGYNTDILGCVAERASGMPLDELIRTRITGPLKMDDTYFFVPTGQRRASRPCMRATRPITPSALPTAHADKGITSTVRARASRAARASSRPRRTTLASSRWCETAARSAASASSRPTAST